MVYPRLLQKLCGKMQLKVTFILVQLKKISFFLYYVFSMNFYEDLSYYLFPSFVSIPLVL